VTQEVESARTNRQWYCEAIIYQAHVRALLDSTSDGVGDFPGLTSFLRAYLAHSAATPIGDARDALLQFFMLDRSLRELDGEVKNRTEWISIPLNGPVDLLGLR
jgi:hypothetical protein